MKLALAFFSLLLRSALSQDPWSIQPGTVVMDPNGDTIKVTHVLGDKPINTRVILFDKGCQNEIGANEIITLRDQKFTLNTPSPSQAPTLTSVPSQAPSELFVTVVNRNSQKCLDVFESSTADNANIEQFDCTGNDNQKFNIELLTSGHVRIIAKHSGKCLDGIAGGDGANIVQHGCNGGPNQSFEMIDRGDGAIVFKNLQYSTCVDLTDSSTANRANLQLWGCNGSVAQNYVLSPGPAPSIFSNVALGGVASQSCLFESGFPEKAIDGNTDCFWDAGFMAQTCTTDNPWWQVDLGDRFLIVRIVIWSRDGTARLNNSALQILAEDGTTINSEVTYGDVTGQIPITATFGSGVEGRYVKIQSSLTNTPLNIAEVMVFGIRAI